MGERIVFERAKLYEQVWSRPLRHLAKDYGVSDAVIAQVCTSLRVPRPPRHHWVTPEAKRTHAALPPLNVGERGEVTIDRDRVTASGLLEAEPLHPDVALEAAALVDRALKLADVELPKGVRVLHRFLLGDPDEPKGGPDGTLRLWMKGAVFTRGRRIAHVLLTTLERLGVRLQVADNGWNGTFEGTVGGTTVAVRLRERLKKVPVERRFPWATIGVDEVPTGFLEITIEGSCDERLPRRAWRESEGVRLDDQLKDVVVGIARAFASFSAHEARLSRQRALWASEQDEHQRRQRVGQIEVELTKDIEARAEKLASAAQLREFLMGHREAISARGGVWKTWLAWAEERVSALEREALEADLPEDGEWFLEHWQSARLRSAAGTAPTTGGVG